MIVADGDHSENESKAMIVATQILIVALRQSDNLEPNPVVVVVVLDTVDHEKSYVNSSERYLCSP